jgi:hypothetical protein
MDHRRKQQKSEMVEFHMDFCFPGGELDAKTQTILVIRERATRMTMASAVPSKSTGTFIAKRGVAFMKEVGSQFGTVILKSDQEPAIKAVVDEMCKVRAADGEVKTEVVQISVIRNMTTRSVVEASPVGSSGSNGVVERAVQSVEQQMRVMRNALEKRCDVQIEANSCIWSWMAEYAAVLLNRMEIGHDGKTAYERLKGKKATLHGFEFGEKVLWRRKTAVGALGKLTCLWEDGIFLGVKSLTGEFIVGDAKGVWRTRSMHRKPVEHRWDGEALAKVTGVPWRTSEEDQEVDGERLPSVTKVMSEKEEEGEKENLAGEGVPRRFPISRKDLTAHGYTSGCPGCKAVLRGGIKQKHTPACRARLEKEMSGEDKVKTAVEKENRFVEKAIEIEEKRKADERKVAEKCEKRAGHDHLAKKEDMEPQNAKKRKTKDEEIDEDHGTKRSSEQESEDAKKMRSMAIQGEKRSRGEESSDEGVGPGQKKKFVNQVMTKELLKRKCPSPHEDDSDAEPSWDECEFETLDSTSGKILDAKLVKEARREEVEFIEAIPVYDVVDVQEAWDETGKGPISGKWVDVEKRDMEKLMVRSRWVARDFKPRGEKDREDLFADMPPLEAKRLLFRMAKVDDYKNGHKRDLKMLLVDVRKAHLNPVCEDKAYVEIPPESKFYEEGKCGRLKRWLYGMRPAAQAWQRDYTARLVGAGFVRGRASNVIFYHEAWGVRAVVHGDDFTFMGEKRELIEVRKLMQEWYEVKVRGMMGEEETDTQEMTLLNRRLRWSIQDVEYEADPQHAKKIIEDLGFDSKTNSISSPMVKEGKETGEEEGENSEELDPESATGFRRVAARCNYLAQDRIDIGYAVKTICRDMSKPTELARKRLRRLGRYLIGRPRAVYKYKQVSSANVIDVYTDSDWAGDRATRKSTSGGILVVNGGVIKSWSKSQTVIARSSGEAEFYALNKGLAEALGLRSLAKDMGYDFTIRVHVDSSAAKAMASRTGLGKTRHINVEYLWSQEVVREKFVQVRKIPGLVNPADIGTKPLNFEDIRRLSEIVNVHYSESEQ